ncbi:MAG: DUF362 domain-containing protein [Chloroflexota bacterium]|nr:DUF362 domain-containing protein [Chloroflexota bacterium]
MSQVWLFRYAKGGDPLEGIQSLFDKSGFDASIADGNNVVVKLHMGELGNIRYLRPSLVWKVVDIVTGRGGHPFLFDTVASYPGERDTKEKYLSTAARNGFAEATVGARVVIADDDDEQLSLSVDNRISGCELVEVKASSMLMTSDCVIVMSHVKGHELAGFGGAIKNIAMGCVSSETKRAQHAVNMPVFDGDDCDGCGKCAADCPTGAIEMVDERPCRDEGLCISCGTCYFKCPLNCWVWPEGSKERLQIYMAHTASTVLAGYQGRVGFLNFIQDVVPDCDCAAPSGEPVVQDVGIVFSFDPVAVDKASLDLVDRSPVIPRSINVKPPDILGKMHHTNSLVQLETAERLGAGSMRYRLVPV